VRPNVFSKSGGVKISLPTTEDLNPGAYSSILSNTKNKNDHVFDHDVLTTTTKYSAEHIVSFCKILLEENIVIYSFSIHIDLELTQNFALYS
jgi:hypothetical protein